jgi:hypothetical protein
MFFLGRKQSFFHPYKIMFLCGLKKNIISVNKKKSAAGDLFKIKIVLL